MTTNSPSDLIKINIENAYANMAKKIKYVGHDTPIPTLVAVSKLQPDDRIEAALQAGQRVFGENRVQEAQTRWHHRKKIYPDLELRLIGGLQTNKARQAVELFDVIESVDRPKLVDALKKEARLQNKSLDIYIQVNTGAEPQKNGVLVQDLPHLIEYTRSSGLSLKGLMCIPPAGHDPAPHFALLNKLAKHYSLKGLSMGMSSDYDLAAAMGATSVRIGTAIFGKREK